MAAKSKPRASAMRLVDLPLGKFTIKRLHSSGFAESTVEEFLQDEISFLRTPDLGRKHIEEIKASISSHKKQVAYGRTI